MCRVSCAAHVVAGSDALATPTWWRVVTFAEKQKLDRQQKTLQKKLLAATTDEEKATLQQQLDTIAEDLLYVTVRSISLRVCVCGGACAVVC